METPCLCPSEWHQHGGRYICYPVLLRTREFITRGTLVSPKRLEIEEYSISKQRALLRWKLLRRQVQFLVSVTRYESKNSGGSINLYFRYLVKLTSCEMFEVSFWKVLPSHGSLIEKKKKEKERQYLYQYYNLFPAILFNINGKIEIYVLLIITSGKMVIRVFTDLKYMEWLKNFLKISLL